MNEITKKSSIVFMIITSSIMLVGYLGYNDKQALAIFIASLFVFALSIGSLQWHMHEHWRLGNACHAAFIGILISMLIQTGITLYLDTHNFWDTYYIVGGLIILGFICGYYFMSRPIWLGADKIDWGDEEEN